MQALVTSIESKSYVMTGSQSASLSWNEAPICCLWSDFYYYQIVAGLLMCGALSDERTSLLFTIAAGPCQRTHSWVQVPRDSWPYLTVWDSRLSKPGGPGPHIHIPQNRMAQLYPQTLGSLFITFYESQGYGGGIQTHLHAGLASIGLSALLI
jgi:hypothetical protein